MKSISMRETPVEVEFHVFSSARPISADMESEAFSAGYLEKYYPI